MDLSGDLFVVNDPDRLGAALARNDVVVLENVMESSVERSALRMWFDWNIVVDYPKVSRHMSHLRHGMAASAYKCCHT